MVDRCRPPTTGAAWSCWSTRRRAAASPASIAAWKPFCAATRAGTSSLLGVPSNDFGGQEPGSNDEIRRFCDATFDVTFPLAARQVVSGPGAHPLYRWAAAPTGTLGTPNWNFHKILIGRDGRVIDWFSALSGTGRKLDRAIEAALATAR